MSKPVTMWAVYARYHVPVQRLGDHTATTEQIRALCATKEQAIAAMCALAAEEDGSDGTPRWEQGAFFVREQPHVNVIGLVPG